MQLTSVPADTPQQICTQTERVNPLVEHISQIINSAVQKVLDLISGGMKLLSYAFGSFGLDSVANALNGAVANFNKFVEITNSFLQKLDEIMHGIMMPWIMPDYAEKWTKISDHMWNISEILGPEALRAPGAKEWTGKAAESYRMIAAKYVAAAGFASEIAMAHSTLLDDSAISAQNLYMAILGLIIAIIAAILTSTAAASTIVGIPAAIFNLVKEAFPLGEEIISTVTELLFFIEDQVSAFIDIKARLQGASYHFPDGSWPPAGG